MSSTKRRDAFNALSTCEEKSRFALDEMRRILSDGGKCHMGAFWEAKQLCLEAFKGEIPQPKRGIYWSEFTELSEEGKRLKKLLDKESTFLASQLELAMGVLGEEVDGIEGAARRIETPRAITVCRPLERHKAEYVRHDGTLTVARRLVARYKHLREEVLKADMRARQRSELLDRLGSIGNRLYAVRAEHAEEVSRLFKGDVDRFASDVVPKTIETAPSSLRRDIKYLQESAKRLGIQHDTFTACRKKLSSIWNDLAAAEEKVSERYADTDQAMQSRVGALKEGSYSDIRDFLKKVNAIRSDVSSAQMTPHLKKELLIALSVKEEEVVSDLRSKAKERKASKELAHEQLIDDLQKAAASPSIDRIESLRKGVDAIDKTSLERMHASSLLMQAIAALAASGTAPSESVAEAVSLHKDLLTAFKKAMEHHHFDLEMAIRYRQIYEEGREHLARAEKELRGAGALR